MSLFQKTARALCSTPAKTFVALAATSQLLTSCAVIEAQLPSVSVEYPAAIGIDPEFPELLYNLEDGFKYATQTRTFDPYRQTAYSYQQGSKDVMAYPNDRGQNIDTYVMSDKSNGLSYVTILNKSSGHGQISMIMPSNGRPIRAHFTRNMNSGKMRIRHAEFTNDRHTIITPEDAINGLILSKARQSTNMGLKAVRLGRPPVFKPAKQQPYRSTIVTIERQGRYPDLVATTQFKHPALGPNGFEVRFRFDEGEMYDFRGMAVMVQEDLARHRTTRGIGPDKRLELAYAMMYAYMHDAEDASNQGKGLENAKQTRNFEVFGVDVVGRNKHISREAATKNLKRVLDSVSHYRYSNHKDTAPQEANKPMLAAKTSPYYVLANT